MGLLPAKPNVTYLNARNNHPVSAFCHIKIDNLLRSSTISLNFTGFRAGRKDVKICGDMENKVVVTDSETHSWPIREILCTGNVRNGTVFLIYNNPLIDIYVQNNPFNFLPGYDYTVQFNLSVIFHRNSC